MKRLIGIAIALLIGSSSAQADFIPLVNDEPEVNLRLDPNTLEYFGKILASSRMAPHMDCSLKAETRTELRKFTTGEQYVQVIEIHFRSRAGFNSDMNFKIPVTAKFGKKISTNPWSGLGEYVKIQLDDYYGHYISFIHDGSGHLVYLMLGNNVRTAPCLMDL
ncbi:MAG: hypothetical protein C5B49_05265 [Bdellovibrio sp.]|nr:MAG: hypothetical protein C5B49_05265 [Bdellovibrio sp.]